MSGASRSEAAEWLALAAAPTFAVMALATAATGGGPLAALCGTGGPSLDGLSLDGMVVMYLLMSAFHLSPWLKRWKGRGRDAGGRERTIEETRQCLPPRTR